MKNKKQTTYIESIDDLHTYEYAQEPEIESVIETATSAFMLLDSAISDIKYSISKHNRKTIMDNAINNLDHAFGELESLREQCLDEERWDNLDKKIVWEKLGGRS